MVGFCGGFTTFSSFTNENLILMQNGQFLTVILYTALSVLLGFLAVYLGYILAS
jgi:CrcB protein